MTDVPAPSVRAILDRLHGPSDDPVARVRRMVEPEVPPERRGLGWDRHWREREAYVDLTANWWAKDDDTA